jgi:hypothetical protein
MRGPKDVGPEERTKAVIGNGSIKVSMPLVEEGTCPERTFKTLNGKFKEWDLIRTRAG